MNPYFSIDHSIDYNNNIYEYIYLNYNQEIWAYSLV